MKIDATDVKPLRIMMGVGRQYICVNVEFHTSSFNEPIGWCDDITLEIDSEGPSDVT
jgi:hypothetical protein